MADLTKNDGPNQLEDESAFLEALVAVRPGMEASISVPNEQADLFRGMVARVFGARLEVTEVRDADRTNFRVSRLYEDETTEYGKPTYFEVRTWFTRFAEVEEQRLPSLELQGSVVKRSYVIPLKRTGFNEYTVYLEEEGKGVIRVRLYEQLCAADDGSGFLDGVRVSWDGVVTPDPGRDSGYLWDFIKKRLPEPRESREEAAQPAIPFKKL